MPDNPFIASRTMTANASLKLFGHPVDVVVTAPVDPVQLGAILPLIQQLADTVVDVAVAECHEQHIAISCKKGCGACCAQAVPLAPAEARLIRDLVKALPEPRRSTVRDRFRAARQAIEQAGLLDTFLDTSGLDSAEILELGREYLRLQIPCPFLEDQACSIHPQRPVRCREYLVTSSPEFCAGPEAAAITRVQLPAEVLSAMLAVGGEASHGVARWVPLTVALEWAESNPDLSMPRPGTRLVQDLFETLSGTKLPPADVPSLWPTHPSG